MKRTSKCVGKKKFTHRSIAISFAKDMYMKYGTRYGLYECPSCLDFHLTTKYCNLQSKYEVWKYEKSKKRRRYYCTLAFNTSRKIQHLFSKIDYSNYLYISIKLLK